MNSSSAVYVVTSSGCEKSSGRNTGAPVRWHSSNAVYRYGSSCIRSSSIDRQTLSHGSPNAHGSCRAVPMAE
jgi:hypothetical protein